MPEYNLLALDIDGTIMDKNFDISARMKSAIKKSIEKGIKVVLATGRMYCATVDIAKELGIQTPLLTYQGALVKDLPGKVFEHLYLEEIGARGITEDLRNLDVQINAYINDELIVEEARPALVDYTGKRHIPYTKVPSFDILETFNPTKLLAIDYDEKKLEKVRKILEEKYGQDFYITKSTPYFCEIANKKISKGKAIAKLADGWGIDAGSIMAIGDQENDIEMFRSAGLAVAMGNAPDIVKSSANAVTDDVDNDGAAKIIEECVL